MDPRDGVRQLSYVIDANLDEVGPRTAATYRRSFERAAAEDAVADLASALSDRVQAGDRPTPEEADAHVDRILASGVAADGGE